MFCFIHYLAFLCSCARFSPICSLRSKRSLRELFPIWLLVNWSESKNSRGQNAEKLFVRERLLRRLPNLPLVFNIHLRQVTNLSLSNGKEPVE